MGRKIPGKKHRHVKDPEVQRAKRLKAIKDKVNLPPTKIDHQEMPKSVLRIMELKERAKKLKPKTENNKKKLKLAKKAKFDMSIALGKDHKMPGMEKPDRFIEVVKQGERESVNSYIGRVYRACNNVINEVKFEDEYKVEVKRDEAGAVTKVEAQKTTRKSKKLKISKKRKERELKKKESQEITKEFPRPETIEFGDVVHRPPTLSVRPRQAIKDGVRSKPGQRDLLLKNPRKVMASKGQQVNDIKSLAQSVKKKTKEKLSTFQKQKKEERRKLVVEAFRNLKKEKFKR